MNTPEQLADYCESLAKEIDHTHFTHSLTEAAAELRRLAGEVANRNARALKGDEAMALREQHVDKIMALEAENKALKADAERYRAFIGQMCDETFDTWTTGYRMQQIAENIQAATKETP